MITHRHHIIPIRMGGPNHPSNIIELTIEEHAEEHKLLWWMYGQWQDELAWKMLSGLIPYEEGRRLAVYNTNKGRPLSKEHKKKIGLGNRGKKHSLETIEKRVSCRRNIPRTLETKNKISSSLLGHKLSPETIKKKSESMKGKTWSIDSNTQKRIWSIR